MIEDSVPDRRARSTEVSNASTIDGRNTESDPAASQLESWELDRIVHLHSLTFLDEGDEVTVGRPDANSYVTIPADGAALLQRLVIGDTLRQAQSWYSQKYDETVDIADFLDTLAELDFLADAPQPEYKASPVGRWARTLLSPWALAGYGLVILSAVVVLGVRPELLPNYRHLFYVDSLLIVLLTMFLGQFPLLFLHEWFHALAGRRIGLRSKVQIGRRLYFVVFETAMDGLVSVPRRQRYLPILAGILADSVVAATFSLVAAVAGSPWRELCLALATSTTLRILWQFYFYLRTDLYYLVVTMLGCVNLHAVSRNMLKRRLARLIGARPPAPIQSVEADHRTANWYSWLQLVGYGFLTISLIVVVIPSMVYMSTIVSDRIAQHAPLLLILDGIAVVVLIVGQFIVAAGMAIRDRRQRTSQL